MSDVLTNDIVRDTKGRFVSGVKPGPGRPKGSRNRLTEDFLRDLADVWEEHGKEALICTAKDEPAKFASIVASLMPREATLDVNVDFTAMTDTAEIMRAIVDELGEAAAQALQAVLDAEKPLPAVIEHTPVDEVSASLKAIRKR